MKPRLTSALIAAVVAAIAVFAVASAGDETPTSGFGGLLPCKEVGSDPLCPRLTEDDGLRSIAWQNVEAAASYRVEASGTALRINAADPFCTAPLADAVQTIAIDVTVPGGVAGLPIELPPLPAADAWFIKDLRVTITELDANGATLRFDGFGMEAEAGCDDASGQRPPSTAATALPGVGASTDDYTHAAKAPIGIAIAIIGVAIIAYALWKQARPAAR